MVALRVARAYRTVSDIALSVIAGLPPVDLLATERAIKYREGRHAEEDDVGQSRRHSQLSRGASEEWQRRWDLTEDGLWTHRVLPDIDDCRVDKQETWIRHIPPHASAYRTRLLSQLLTSYRGVS